MKCTEVSLQHRAISHSRIFFFFFVFIFFVTGCCVFKYFFFRSCYPYIQLGTVQNYSHDDGRRLAVLKK